MQTRLTSEIIREYTEKGYWGNLTVSERFDMTAEALQDKVAVIDSQKRTTFGELATMSRRLALILLELGIRPGDRICAQLPNRAEALAVLLAVSRIGVVLAPAVHYYRAAEMEYILAHSDSVAAIIPGRFEGFDYPEMMAGIRPRLPGLKHILVLDDEVPPGAVPLARVLETPIEERYPPDYLAPFRPDPNEVMVLNYSSGTEAAPKAPMWTHNMFLPSHWRTDILGVTADDVVLNLAPLYHGFALVMAGIAASFHHGATLVLMDRFVPEDAVALAERERAQVVLAVPPQVASILALDLSRYDLSSIRAFATGGAAAGVELKRQLRARVGCELLALWGSTEGGSLMARLDDLPEVIDGTVGRPVHPSVEFRILADNQVEQVPVGEIGELAIRGPTVFAGYFKDPQRTAAIFNRDGFCLTGDLAYLGQDGNFRIAGRRKEIINRGGEKISPLEVEEAILAHPGVAAAAVVAMPDQRLGERACVYVVPRDGAELSLGDIVSFLRSRGLATFKLPERLEIVESLPATGSGKVKRSTLREAIERKLRGEG
ncbi:MAG: AMP-binding protein [Dehalococcoidia bacterium]|nr:AMP-binding protein [Dehalococcoidia bacterium]